MSMQPLAILEHVESTMGIRLVREGDKLRMLLRPGADASAARERVRCLRDILYEEVVQRELIDLACGPSDQFSRGTFDALFAHWLETYGAAWDFAGDVLPSESRVSDDASKQGA